MPAKVTIFNNGSIRLEGDFTVHDADGNEFGLAGRTALLRRLAGPIHGHGLTVLPWHRLLDNLAPHKLAVPDQAAQVGWFGSLAHAGQLKTGRRGTQPVPPAAARS